LFNLFRSQTREGKGDSSVKQIQPGSQCPQNMWMDCGQPCGRTGNTRQYRSILQIAQLVGRTIRAISPRCVLSAVGPRGGAQILQNFADLLRPCVQNCAGREDMRDSRATFFSRLRKNYNEPAELL